jgi:cation diffusion facilitator CzcD-associated flavoprotein CzcO
VTAASWSSAEARWTIEAEVGDTGQVVRCSARFLYLCTGYYRYDAGYQPTFPGADMFSGMIVHPQQWPEALDYRGQKVVIVGSGATAMTLAPAMADTAEHVTVLQRSPSYVLSLPAVDAVAQRLRRVLPERWAYRLVRWKNVMVATTFFQLCRRAPRLAKWLLRQGTVSQLPEGYAVEPNFAPPYDPWDQRMCIVPDGDLFKAITAGRVTMVTDQIDHFNPTGIALASGDQLDADLIVSATGLALVACGGIRLEVDGAPREPSESFMYGGFMLSGFPNLAICFGYTNASWTLRADLVSQSVCRLLKRMDREGTSVVVPDLDSGGGPGAAQPLLDLSSGYVTRACAQLPKQGSRGRWKFRQNYIIDVVASTFGRVGKGLDFSNGDTPLGRTTTASRP